MHNPMVLLVVVGKAAWPALTGLAMPRNNEVQFAGAFGEQGVRYTLDVPAGQHDVLSRQVSPSRGPACCWHISSSAGSLVSKEASTSWLSV